MRIRIVAIFMAFSALAVGSAWAEEGAPAAPSGAPKAAAENGSSDAGKAGAKNEMSSHESNTAKQGEMADPHKQAH